MNSKRKNGFSLVELLAGVTSGAVIALIISATLWYGYKGWTRLTAEKAMQCDADVAMRTINRVARGATNATWIAGTLNITMTNGVAYDFVKQGSWPAGHLKFDSNILVSNRVFTFTGMVWSNSIIVVTNFTLKEGLETLDMPFSIFMRN